MRRLVYLIVLIVVLSALPAFATIKSVASDPTGEACVVQVPETILRHVSGAGVVTDYTCQNGTYQTAYIGGEFTPTEITTAERPWYNVEHPTYGANSSSGAEANQTAIQAAFDACESDGGGTVILPKNYTTLDLTMADGCSLLCVGDGSGLTADTGTDILLTYGETACSAPGCRAKTIYNCDLNGNDTASTVLKVGPTGHLTVVSTWIRQGAASGSKGLYLSGTQNSTFIQVKMRDSDINLYLDEGASNNHFIDCEWNRQTTACIYATNDGGADMHGNTFSGLCERDRDGNETPGNCGPQYGVYLEGGRDWKFSNFGVNSAPQEGHFYLVGVDSPKLSGSDGVTSVYMDNVNINLAADGCDGTGGDPAQQDWTTDGGIYAQGFYELRIDGININNGNNRMFLEPRGNCSTTTATDCYADADAVTNCGGGETCENQAQVDLYGYGWSDAGEPDYLGKNLVQLLGSQRSGEWIASNRILVDDNTVQGSDQIELRSQGDYAVSLRLCDNYLAGCDGDWRIQGLNGQVNFKNLDSATNTTVWISGNSNGYLSLGGANPAFQFRDTDLNQSTNIAQIQAACSGSVGSDADCDLTLSSYVNDAMTGWFRFDADDGSGVAKWIFGWGADAPITFVFDDDDTDATFKWDSTDEQFEFDAPIQAGSSGTPTITMTDADNSIDGFVISTNCTAADTCTTTFTSDGTTVMTIETTP